MIFEKYKDKIWPILLALSAILVIVFLSHLNIGNLNKVNNFAYVFSAGDGSSGNPYQITSWTDLNGIRDDLTAYYKLVENLSSTTLDYHDFDACSDTQYTNQNDCESNGGVWGFNWTPIGDDAMTPFIGNFNGDGKTISDLIIYWPARNYFFGLFGYVEGETISNLGLISINITGTNYVGGFAGYQNGGTITNSYSTGSVTGTVNSVGGLVGAQWTGTISNSYSAVSITSTGDGNAGGLIGYSFDGIMTNSYSTGSVTGSGDYIFNFGGLVGRQDGGTISNSYSTANVTGPTNLMGGLVGWQYNFGTTTIINSYSIGEITYNGGNPSLGVGGGLVGASDYAGTAVNSFWDTETSGRSTSAGGTGKTTAKMKGLYTYNSNGGNWDITGGALNLNNGYPYLAGSISPVWLIPSTVVSDPTPRRRITHSECDWQGQCVSVLGQGSNQCSIDMDCIITATTTEEIATTTATTTPEVIVCSLDNDCGMNTYIDTPFCQDNNVYQNYTNYLCNNASTTSSLCSSTTVAQIKTTCLSNQLCTDAICVNKIIKHSQCVGLSCVEVDGEGPNTCQTNNDCKIKEVIICGDNTCSPTENCNSCSLDCGDCEVINPIVGETPPSTGNPIVGDDVAPVMLGTSESFFENITKIFTTDVVLEKINIIASDLDKVINSPQGEVVTKTVSTAGAVTVVAVTAGTVSFSISDIILLLIRSFNLLLTAFGLKKRVSPWGTAFDSVTKQPLDPAYVVLKNMEGKEVASAITDLDGRFGFLVEPGIYQLFPKKTNYIFPSKELFGKTHDALHKDLYFGETVEVKTLGEVIIKNIPLDPVNFDWNEFAKRDKGLMKFYSKWDVVKREIINWFFIICFILAVVTYYFSPYPYNLAIIILYVFLSLIIIFGLKPKTYGYIKEKETGFPLSFAIVRVFLSGSDTIIASKTTDKYGKYYCLVPPGKYYIKVEKKNDDGSYSILYTSSDIDVTQKGIINVNFRV
ncbi:MAG: hypothetical protein NTU76_02855 [Candidatus Taylorbacteria bacterium]|nr:hypothetical protein [Candidatus Taylorbacteria bacterium]